MRILFCIVIAIPKGMSGKYFLKVSSISDIAIMNKLQIKTLKFVYSSCCFTIPELVLSDQLIADTHNFRTNFFRPTKFRTNKFPDQLFFGFLTILTEKTWSDYRCFTVSLLSDFPMEHVNYSINLSFFIYFFVDLYMT